MAKKKKQDELLGHDYDGIQEYDNDLPPWWINLFYITIILSVLYLLWFQVFPFGDSQTVRYMKSVDPTYERLPEHQGESLIGFIVPDEHSIWHNDYPEVTQASLFGGGEPVEAVVVPVDTSVVPRTDAASLASGKAIYDQYCFTCHGMQGEGGIGPNLTDIYWIHGGRYADVVHTITYGVPIKGMIAWQSQLNADQIAEVSSYVHDVLRGTSPANAKAPQGDEFLAADME